MNKKIALILIIVTAPVFIAIYLFNINYKGNTQQQGMLLPKAIKLDTVILEPITQHKWHLLYIQKNDVKNFTTIIKNFNRILNIHQTESQRLIISVISTKNQTNKLKQLINPNAHIEFISVSLNTLQTLLQKLQRQENTIALLDPRGYLQLIYPTAQWPINLNKDLNKLMKISQTG